MLEDIYFEVENGEVVAILGPSGCGKTTLLKCILGLEKSDSGEIFVGSTRLTEWLKDNRIAYVPQKYANFNYLTVAQNILAALNGQELNLDSLVESSLKNVGLDKFKTSYPGQLSGGMQQRLALARALASGAGIIAFDEPFSSLDVETRQQMQELILESRSDNKKTMLFVTHDIEEAIFLARKIVVMGTKPGVVREIIDVPFNYPRPSSLRFDEEFQKIRRALSFIVRSEGIKGKLSEGEPIVGRSHKIGLYYWPGNSPFFYAQERGWFENDLLPVEFISFSDNRQKIDFWKSGKIDILNVTIDTALRLKKEIPDTEIIMGLNISRGGDALISRDPISSVKEIKNKRVALEKDEISEFFLRYVLYKNGMNLEDVIVADMKGDEIGAALISGRVDAAVLWEPWLSKTLELSRAHVVATSRDFSVFADVLVARKSFAEENKEEIQKIKMIWQKSVDAYYLNKQDFTRAVAPAVGLSARDLASQLELIEFFDGGTKRVLEIGGEIKDMMR